ncbi:MAG: hypothetical protein Cons2KO_29360 [Congregibacter sp.]
MSHHNSPRDRGTGLIRFPRVWWRGRDPRQRLLTAFAMAALLLSPLSHAELVIYDYTVEEKLPQSRQNFVQGLQIFDELLYVGTGQYGESRLLAYSFPDMRLLQEFKLPANLFGEGVTRLGNRIFQLTWRSRRLLEYDADSFRLIKTHTIQTEGWGITHNGSELFYSDGSQNIYVLSPDTLVPRRTITVTLNGRPLPRLNELEWIENEIWANVFQANQLVRIDPDTGRVTAVVDLRGLLPEDERREGTDVLNGIAWDARSRALWVTGKRWPWLYRVSLRKRPAAPTSQPAASSNP